MWRSRARVAYVVLPALTAIVLGCAEESPTSIDAVVTEEQPGLGQRLDVVRITFTRQSAGEARLVDRAPVYEQARFTPITVRFTPSAGDPPGELYRVRAEGLVGTDVLVAVQHRVPFVPGRRIVLPLRFAPECVSIGCGDEETCEDGRCVSDLVAACALDADIAPEACGRLDAGAGDGGPVQDGSDDGGSNDAPPPPPPPPPGSDAAAPCEGCDDGLACTDDACTPDGTCTHVVNDGRCPAGQLCVPPAGCADLGCDADADCDDGDGCTTDRCVGASCVHAIIRCMALGPCTATACDPAIGRCVSSPMPDGVPCDGGICCGAVCYDPSHSESACGTCGNVCGPGISCIDSACRACTADAECNDALACTSDACVSGRCVRSPVDGCVIQGSCVSVGERDPTDACRACVPAMNLDRWTAVAGGSACDDGSACTEGDRCSEGRCVAGTPVDCSDGEVCTEDACDDSSGGCSRAVVRGHCLIDGACYGEGQSAPSDPCQVCDPRSDPRAWTRRARC